MLNWNNVNQKKIWVLWDNAHNVLICIAYLKTNLPSGTLSPVTGLPSNVNDQAVVTSLLHMRAAATAMTQLS